MSQIKLICEILPVSLQTNAVIKLIEFSLAEDLNPQGFKSQTTDLSRYDLTSAAIFPFKEQLSAKIFSKAPGVIAGLPLAEVVFTIVDQTCHFSMQVNDGDQVSKDQTLALVKGSASGLLAAERTALNFLGRLSGIASTTHKFVAAVKHTNAKILDTRKTAPGYRLLDKYAVRMGGGMNHRMGLYDMILIKNNHIDRAGGVKEAVMMVRDHYGDQFQIEIEVRTLEELESALALRPTRILLDNMDLDTMRKAVEFTQGKVPLEASGNVSLNTVKDIAETGVDFISSGSLTHSAPVLDISMHLMEK